MKFAAQNITFSIIRLIMSREEKIKQFDPNAIGIANGNLFGLPFTPEEAQLVILPMPWEVTVSYRPGTANGPQAILDASLQVDLFDSEVEDAWKMGIAMLPIDEAIKAESDTCRKYAEEIIQALENEQTPDENAYNIINAAGEKCKNDLKARALEWMNKGKCVALLGGDHSTPLGLIEALTEKYDNFGILHIDAHCDLREAYEGFTYSHASIMYNALKYPQISKLVQVGIRDFCESEANLVKDSNERVMMYEYRTINKDRFRGKSWDEITDEIVAALPDNIYVSFDIDGLNPQLCPNTGTPVPGGFMFEEALYLIEKVVEMDKKIIGFDLNEVAPGPDDEWDANVGARVLYRLCNYMGQSQKLLS